MSCLLDLIINYVQIVVQVAPHLIGEPPVLRKLKSAFANKNSSLIQTMISFIFVKIYASEVIFLVCE